MTRGYRAPEVILKEPNYDFKIDIWSVGCVFGELLNFTKSIKSRPIFVPNTSISYTPIWKSNNFTEEDGQEQIVKIMKVVGN